MIGRLYRVMAETSGHAFEIGEIVRQTGEWNGGRPQDVATFEHLDGRDFWYCRRDEVSDHMDDQEDDTAAINMKRIHDVLVPESWVPPEGEVVEVDIVNHPPHYTQHPSGVECIQITEHMGFNLGNVFKYVWRADLKHDDSLEDLEKAKFYLQREIDRRIKLAQ
jgi:hypothetical protein